eukprot:8765950-Lingulodinium_polyedra.AAC.1
MAPNFEEWVRSLDERFTKKKKRRPPRWSQVRDWQPVEGRVPLLGPAICDPGRWQLIVRGAWR